jgi:hypothetical protein
MLSPTAWAMLSPSPTSSCWWRIKSEDDKMGHMARRPDSPPILSRDDLDEFRRRLALLSASGVEGVYNTAHNDCRYDGKRLPPPAAIQQLVTAWKVLRKLSFESAGEVRLLQAVAETRIEIPSGKTEQLQPDPQLYLGFTLTFKNTGRTAASIVDCIYGSQLSSTSASRDATEANSMGRPVFSTVTGKRRRSQIKQRSFWPCADARTWRFCSDVDVVYAAEPNGGRRIQNTPIGFEPGRVHSVRGLVSPAAEDRLDGCCIFRRGIQHGAG